MKVLLLSRWAPFPADNGARIRISNVVRALAQDHQVSLIAFDDRGDGARQTIETGRAYCTHVQTVPYRPFRPTGWRAITGFASRAPRSLVDTFSTDMRMAIAAELQRDRPDLVVASQLDMVPYAHDIRGIPSVLEELELSFYRDAIAQAHDATSRLRAWLRWTKLGSYLRSALPRFNACTVASTRELDNVRAIAPTYRSVSVIPNAIDYASYQRPFGAPVPESLVFSGAMTYFANADAARFLVRDIFPRIRQVRANARLRITGSTHGVNLGEFQPSDGVSFTGHLDDVRPVIAESTVAVVPLRLGGGTRLKILEAMALGTPVVSTTKGAEGLDVRDGESILLADDPGEFARRVLDLVASPELRARLSTAGRHVVRERYDWSVVAADLRSIVREAAMGTDRGAA